MGTKAIPTPAGSYLVSRGVSMRTRTIPAPAGSYPVLDDRIPDHPHFPKTLPLPLTASHLADFRPPLAAGHPAAILPATATETRNREYRCP